ncbi:MAG: PilZ domain-containing protein [Candidatus Omnitrophica bacterium]|nr:PilZ domain-containing protein [Candidatus Omnitrophota bacterium]
MKPNQERRKYVRLAKIIPVELKIIDSHNTPRSDLLQGFTRDVSFEGVCVEINNFSPEYASSLAQQQGKIVVFINIPLQRHPVKAVARLAWSKHTAVPYPDSYVLGLSYEGIDPEEQKRIIRYARRSRSIPRFIAAGFALLLICALFLAADNFRLTRINTRMVQQLALLADEQYRITVALDKIAAEKTAVAAILQKSSREALALRESLAKVERQQLTPEADSGEIENLTRERQQLQTQLALLNDDKDRLEKRLAAYTDSQTQLESKLEKIAEEKIVLEDKSLDLMHQWLINGQNSKTGLVLSYDNDSALLDVGFTYDQALSALSFIHFREFERARRIFDFFRDRAGKVDNGFANAYDVATGKVSEYVVHSGPPIYLGLAMLAYEDAARDPAYRGAACNIADWLLGLQRLNPEGALPGGPRFTWVGTEQNIAGYVFLSRLAKTTGDERYSLAAGKILVWLEHRGYNGKLKRFNRGDNDRMIATDTIALSIMAFGPDKLQAMGVDVDGLISCVEENCKVSLAVKGIAGRKKQVTGYDFCSPSSIGRSGTIAVEWTGQMVVAYRELEKFYERAGDAGKAQYYRRQARYFLGEMEKLILVRSAFGKKKGMAGLPYSANTGVDTGHGWNTPDTASISAAGTNFAIFAKEEYNMFKL